MTSDAITRLIELSRRVATQAGADLYNKPIGSIIGPDSSRSPQGASSVAPKAPDTSSMPKNAPGRTTGGPDKVNGVPDKETKRPITLERIRSLQSQLRTAQKVDNTATIKAVRKELGDAITDFTKNRSPAEVRELLLNGVQ